MRITKRKAKSVISYLFKPPRRQAGLPLLPLEITSNSSRYGTPAPDQYADIALLIKANVARTPEDAFRLLKKYPALTVVQIVNLLKRNRKRISPLWRAWERFWRLW